jgi:hypothetical protein
VLYTSRFHILYDGEAPWLFHEGPQRSLKPVPKHLRVAATSKFFFGAEGSFMNAHEDPLLGPRAASEMDVAES